MKHNYSLSLLLGLFSVICRAQVVEVPLNKEFDGVTVLSFKPPYDLLKVYINDDFDTRYSTLTISPQTLFLKRSLGSRKLEKLKPGDYIEPADIRPGMRIDMQIDHYQISMKNTAKELVMSDKYYRSASVDGLYEFYDGQKASVDGQLVVLNPGVVIKGQKGWDKKTFTSFNELQLGCALDLYGKREKDGVVYIARGTATPVELTTEDRLLRRGVSLGMKIDRDNLSMGSFSRPIITKDELSDYVNTVGNSVIPQYIRSLPPNHPDHIDFKFYVVEDTTLNASAMADGTVIVHTGMLKKIDNEAQLAAILGHEVAHVTQQHHAKNYRNRQNWKSFTDIVSVASVLATGSVAPAMIVAVTSEMYVGKYNRSQETQADRIGLRYMFDAGYDPRETAAIWRKLAEDDMNKSLDAKALTMMLALNGSEKSNIPDKAVDPEKEESIYASHPRSRDRFNHVNFLLSTTYANADFSKSSTNELQYVKMVSLLKAPKTPKMVPSKSGGKVPLKTGGPKVKTGKPRKV